MKAVILARVSSKEQEDGHSLDAQVTYLTEYASRKQLDVINKFIIIESSTQGERKKFNDCIKFCKSQKETVALITYNVDRLQRSFTETPVLNELLKKEKIELHFAHDNMIINKDSPANTIIMWNMSVVTANAYILHLSDNVTRSLNHKLENGQIIRQAPIGYKNIKNERGESDVQIDPYKGPIVKRLFTEYSRGNCSLKELTHRSRIYGLKSRGGSELSKNAMDVIISNPFYYGEMLIKKHNRLYPHKYQPLISKRMWDLCQEIKSDRSAKHYRFVEKEFLLPGLITCANSGLAVCTEQKKGKYNYLVCFNKQGERVYVKEQDVIDQIQEMLYTLFIPREILNSIKKHLKKLMGDEKIYHAEAITALRKELDTVDKRIRGLVELLMDEKIDKEIFDIKMTEYKNKKFEIQGRLDNHAEGDTNFLQTIANLFETASCVGSTFRKSSDYETKREILKLTTRTLTLDCGKLSYALRFPFSEMLNLSNSEIWLRLLDSNQRPIG